MNETVLIEKLSYKAPQVCDQVIFWTASLWSFLPIPWNPAGEVCYKPGQLMKLILGVLNYIYMKLLNEVNCPFGGSIINMLMIPNFYISAQIQYKSWLRVWRLPGPRMKLQAHSQTKQEEIEFLHGKQVCKLGYTYTLHSFGWLWSWRHLISFG